MRRLCLRWRCRRATTPAVEDTSEWVRIITPEGPDLLLNNILRFRPNGPVTAQEVERAIAPYRKYHLPFQWWLRRPTAIHTAWRVNCAS